MWVKICGNINLEDAVHAAASGADAVGFVFAESKRRVTVAQVAAITPHLPVTVERVGVFDTHDAEEITRVALNAGLTAVQLHGGMDETLLDTLAERLADRVQIIQVLHWTVDVQPVSAGDSNVQGLAHELGRIAVGGIAARVLIDSKVGNAGGGTGLSYDWSAARDVFASAPSSLHLIVAGGLRPDNVRAAIAELKPWGVDVSSGVERSTGRKDRALVELFMKNARS